MAMLTGIRGPTKGHVFSLDGEKFVLGRNADCAVVINVPAVSREHACIRKIAGKFYIEDLKSRNGTFVNEQEVTARVLLKENDRIKICDTLFEFLEAPPKPPLPPELKRGGSQAPEEGGEERSSTVEATLSHSSKRILEPQPAEELAVLLDITSELTQTPHGGELLPRHMNY